MAEPTQEYVYLQSNKSINDVAAGLRKSMPPNGNVTVDYIRFACNVSEGTAKNTISDLKKFGFVSEDGVLTERGRLLRNPERYPELGTQVLHDVYPDIISMLELQPEKWATLLDSILADRTNLGGSARSKVRATIGFFWEMAHGKALGGEEKKTTSATSANPKSQSPRKSKSTTPPQSSESLPKGPFLAQTEAVGLMGNAAPKLDIISSVLRVNIDGTWDTEKINLLFDRLERLIAVEELSEQEPE